MQHLHAPTRIASKTCLYLSLDLKSWIQKPPLCHSAPLMISSTSQLLSQVAHIWQDPSISTAVAASGSPQLSWARNQLILWSCSSRRYARVPPVTLGVDILEISVELILIHRVMDLTSYNSRTWGSFTRLWDSEGFILIRDILLLSLWPLGAFGQSWEGGKLAKSECCDL